MLEKKSRNILFLGHANPEDNEFTLWIRQKLINEGFIAECDITILVGGENDYWKNIQECLEYSTIKYLLVLSKKTFQKPGVLDEWEFVRSVLKKYQLNDFIIPLKIDSVPFDARIGLNRINSIDFSQSWAVGLKRLIKKLNNDAVFKNSITAKVSVSEWLNNKYGTDQGIQKRKEIYYSNWVEIESIPQKMYMYEYENDTQSGFINTQLQYPNIKHDKFIISFEEEINSYAIENYTLLSNNVFLVSYKNKKEILLAGISNNITAQNFPSLQDSKNFLIRLLKEAFYRHLTNVGLKHYTYSGSDQKCYYYPKQNDDVGDLTVPYKVKFNYQDTEKKKKLVGKYYSSFWHLGISISIKVHPIFVYEIKPHILFSEDGNNIWNDVNKLHKARRDKGKRLFNAEWRDFLFAFLQSLVNDTKSILIPVNENSSIILSSVPIAFTSLVGYNEPESKARLIPINEFIEDEDDELSVGLVDGE